MNHKKCTFSQPPLNLLMKTFHWKKKGEQVWRAQISLKCLIKWCSQPKKKEQHHYIWRPVKKSKPWRNIRRETSFRLPPFFVCWFGLVFLFLVWLKKKGSMVSLKNITFMLCPAEAADITKSCVLWNNKPEGHLLGNVK